MLVPVRATTYMRHKKKARRCHSHIDLTRFRDCNTDTDYIVYFPSHFAILPESFQFFFIGKQSDLYTLSVISDCDFMLYANIDRYFIFQVYTYTRRL